jgi:plastocyanin
VTKKLLIFLAAMALAAFSLAACGGDDAESSSSADSSTPAADAGGTGATVQVEADPGGSLSWVETDLSTEAGSDTIELVNDSDTPHNVVVESEAGDDVAETETVSGDTTSATAELESGTYTFYCDVPGHREAGMEGTLTVK